LLLGAQHAASQAGSLLLLHPGLTAQRGLELLADRQVDGIIYAEPSEGALWTALDGMPTVVLGGGIQDHAASSVVADEWRGARTIVEVLLEAGHRRIGLLQDLAASPSARDLRLAAYADALAGYDLPLDPDLLGAAELGGNVVAATGLLSRSDPPTALCCGSDVTAIGVYQAAARLGLVIPRDLSVVAFAETLGLGVVLQPGLTSVAVPYEELGRRAVDSLLQQIICDEPVPVVHDVLATTVVDRGSTAPPLRGGPRARRGAATPGSDPPSSWSSRSALDTFIASAHQAS
jgi:LacI family transcriptional regulator